MFDLPHATPLVLFPDCYYARPLVHGLQIRSDMRLQSESQSQIDAALERGTCACALVSPTALLDAHYLSVLPGAGVVARALAPSERLVSEKPLEAIHRIAVTPDAAHLTRYVQVLFADRKLPQPAFQPLEQQDTHTADARLVSGDTGLEFRDEAGHDLASLWRETTDLPLVLGAWVCGPGAPYRLLRQALAESARAGEAQLYANCESGGSEAEAAELLRAHIQFSVLSEASDSIRALHERARRHAICEATVESIAFC